MNNEELLAEIEDLLRNIPERATIRHDTDENFSWFGRLSAIIEAWDSIKGAELSVCLLQFHTKDAITSDKALRLIMTLLHQARHDLRMKTFGPTNVAIEKGMVFDYFDEIRKIIQTATKDLFFIDPYLDAEFVSKYLGNTADRVVIRLLAREKLNTLLPAIDTFTKQHRVEVKVRSAKGFHDRYIIVDGDSCFQSGASFQNGAKKSPTTLTQITDAFPAVQSTYEKMWDEAKVLR